LSDQLQHINLQLETFISKEKKLPYPMGPMYLNSYSTIEYFYTKQEENYYAPPNNYFDKMKDGKGVYVTFKFKTSRDAHFGIFPKKLEKGKPYRYDSKEKFYHFCIAGWNNTKSMI